MLYLFNGVVIGVIVAAPLGPVGLLCIRRALTHGRLAGQLSGFGAATAHSMYGLIVGLGLTGVSNLLLRGQFVIGLIGGVFLCYLGVKTFYAKTHTPGTASTIHKSRLHNYLSTLALALTNPLTILSFLGIFAGFGVQSNSFIDPLLLIAGIFIGSASWWLFLTFFVSLFQHHINTKALFMINRASGVVIFLFGIRALLNSSFS